MTAAETPGITFHEKSISDKPKTLPLLFLIVWHLSGSPWEGRSTAASGRMKSRGKLIAAQRAEACRGASVLFSPGDGKRQRAENGGYDGRTEPLPGRHGQAPH